MKMPEEINRILTDRISSYLFCPTEVAIKNLEKEGFSNFDISISNTGDVMYDVALYYSKFSADKSTVIQRLSLGEKPFVLATLHRQENTDDLVRLKSIISALNQLSKNFEIVLPLHPRTQKILKKEKIATDFIPIEPVGYFDMIEMLKKCAFVMTDSGGLQKEAFFFEKRCLVTRDETEWTELVELNYNLLVGANENKILESANEVISRKVEFIQKPYGDGNAAQKIVSHLEDSLK